MRLPQPRLPGAPSDGELLAAARSGDGASLGLLLERHRPRLIASALRILGNLADAEDAFQDTCVIAMRHFGTIRESEAVGAWLHAVLRRSCLQRRRRRSGERLTGSLPEIIDGSAGVEERIERLELRDWIWGALERLPETLRVTALLRYFGSFGSYEEIANILGIPIGTVRSRLSEAKLKLADALLASAGLIDDDVRARARARERFWAEAFQEIFVRGESDGFVSRCATDLLVSWSSGKTARGREHLAAEIESDLAAGVRLEIERVLGSNGIAVVEGRFVNPPEAREHCPPGIALIVLDDGDRALAIRLHLSPRLPRPEDE